MEIINRVRLALLFGTGALLFAVSLPAHASLVWIYDFPNNPGSGLAADQTNPQPGNATFSNFTRTNVSPVATADVFDSNLWNNTSVFDPTQYEGFSITAASGYHLDLAGVLTFDQMRTSGGPTKGQVGVFLNGSSTAYATYTFNPGASWQSETFNFTPTVDADNVTSVEFRFYGWNGGTPSASLILDNVAVTITSIIPESGGVWAGVVGMMIAAVSAVRAGRRHTNRGK